MSLVKFRIDIERELRALANSSGMTIDRLMGLKELVGANEEVRQYSSTTEFMQILNSLHNTAHGVDVPQNEADHATRFSARFLADI